MKYRPPKKKAPVSHLDDWLMTYADMITLLLCFFAIFIANSMPKQEIPKPPPEPPKVALTVQELPVPENAISALPAQPERLQGNLPFHNEEPLDVAEQKAPETPPDPVDNLKKQGASIEEKGDRLTTIDIASAAFFDSGSATISESGKNLLKDVAVTIQSEKYKDFQVTVEGHTDDSPISTAQFPSNWELSTARASAVVRYVLEQGIPAARLRAAGYADTFPKSPNRDTTNNPIPANQAQNRRVVIKLEKIEKGE